MSSGFLLYKVCDAISREISEERNNIKNIYPLMIKLSMHIPRTMSTQHPDNVRSPFFATNSVLGDEDEVKEAFYAFSHLKIKEQLWDFEGKEVDSSVVRKLLSGYETFFRSKQLGKDVFLTYRVPNPDVEKNEGKILLETLESIPRSFDLARTFYEKDGAPLDIAPIFEVAVPMVTHAKAVSRIAMYYKKFVAGKGNQIIDEQTNKTVASWIGEFFPKSLRVIPLLEDKESLLNADKIVEEFVKEQKIEDHQRVWLARSDPALNYGSAATVLIEKIALQRLHHLSEKISVPLFPILGCGSAPFRGNFKPTNVEANMKAYPSVQTFTLQSAFKYDYEEGVVQNAVQKIEETKTKKPLVVDEEKLLLIIEKLAHAYQQQMTLLAPIINDFSIHIPKRRKRKLHIGLFGYARKHTSHEQEHIHLPRAIPFCASLYSLGLPPELLGLHVLTQKDIEVMAHAYPSFEQDFKDAAQLLNEDNVHVFPNEIVKQIKTASQLFPFETKREHQKITSIILKEWKTKNPVLTENIERAGWVRGFLG